MKKLVFIFCFLTLLGFSARITGKDLPEPVYRGEEGKNQVALAVNVDWGGEYLEEFTAILQEKEARATFFLTGRWIEENAPLGRMLVDAGMELGNHGYTHRSPNAMTFRENREEILAAEESIFRATGVRTTLFAPPSGEREDPVLAAAEAEGYQVILWTADTVDWQKPSVETILSRVEKGLCDGCILLMHPTENTLKALPGILERIEAAGYTPVTLSRLLK